MSKRWLALMATVALALPACDTPSSPVVAPAVAAPNAAVLPGYSYFTGGVLLTGAGNASQTKSATINQYGGKINFGATSLVVPAGAVTGPTKFTFVLRSQPYMAADLKAVDVATGQLVGTLPAGFPVELTLTLSYAGSKQEIPDPTKLSVFYVNGLELQKIPGTSVDVKGKKLITRINHFSEYSPGWDNLDLPPAGGY